MNCILKFKWIFSVIISMSVIGSCKEKPTLPTLTTAEPTSITQTTGISGGNIISDGGGEITAAGICWSTSSNPSLKDEHTNEGKGLGSFTSNLKDLTPGTKYYIKAYATNGAGTAYGNEVSFTTSPEVGTVLTTSNVTSITQTSAVSGGNFTSYGDSPILEKGVCWAATANPTIESSRTNDGSGTGSFISNLTNLQPGTTYQVRAYATSSNVTSYGNEVTFTTVSSQIGSQIIADHTVVDKFDDIPAEYIAAVKKMSLHVLGESHAYAYMRGLVRLESSYPAYDVNFTESGTPEGYTESHLRISLASWGDYSRSSGWIHDDYGEEDWWTNATAISRTKAGIAYAHANNLTIGAVGFGWCTDMFYGTPSGTADPVYECHWSGASKDGPQGDRCWGLDDEDNSITGNTLNLDTYLSVTQGYIDYCTSNNIPTKVFFTTGPVDRNVGGYTLEKGYVAHLKQERIREYVKADASRILFDYADILCYDDDGTSHTETWNGHTYPSGTDKNRITENTGHITYAGSVRLAKALWWMLARMAGWDGGTGTSTVLVGGITVTGAGGATTITTEKGTLQLSAAVTPSNATNKTVTWSISNNTGQASISSAGLVKAVSNGTVTAKGTANDGSGIYGTLMITISNQNILVTGISVTGAGGATTITTDKGTLQLNASVMPTNATNKTVTWSISNNTGQASISSAGLVKAVSNGTVTAKGTANDGSGIYGTLMITISNQNILVTGISVTGAGGATTITTDKGTLQLNASVMPTNATNKTVTWSVSNGTGQASINSTGLVAATANGTVTARATAADGSGVYGNLVITISNQAISVKAIIVTGSKGTTSITTNNGTLQLSASISPTNATNQTVSWSIINETGKASISATGLVTAISDGTVTAQAKANDGSGVFGRMVISISNQIVLVESIMISGTDGDTTITEDNGTLQLFSIVTPVNASNQAVTWSISNGTGQATISESGMVTAIADGAVTARASASDGSGAEGILEITIKSKSSEPLVMIVNENEIKIPLDESYANCILSLYNLQGHLIRSKHIDSNLGTFEISTLPGGLYLIVLSKRVILKVGKVILPG